MYLGILTDSGIVVEKKDTPNPDPVRDVFHFIPNAFTRRYNGRQDYSRVRLLYETVVYCFVYYLRKHVIFQHVEGGTNRKYVIVHPRSARE